MIYIEKNYTCKPGSGEKAGGPTAGCCWQEAELT